MLRILRQICSHPVAEFAHSSQNTQFGLVMEERTHPFTVLSLWPSLVPSSGYSSGYVSSVCCALAGGLVGKGNSPAPYSVLLLKPAFLAKSNPLTPPSTFQDNHLVCS